MIVNMIRIKIENIKKINRINFFKVNTCNLF